MLRFIQSLSQIPKKYTKVAKEIKENLQSRAGIEKEITDRRREIWKQQMQEKLRKEIGQNKEREDLKWDEQIIAN